MTVQTEAKINEMLSNTQTLVERTSNALSVIDKANAKALADIKQASTNFIKTFSSNIEKTVGVGGDFSTLESAISWARQYKDVGNAMIKLVLLPNYTITKQITLDNADLSHVFITSKGEIINVDINYPTQDTWLFAFNLTNSFLYFYDIKFKALKTNIRFCFNCSNSYIYLSRSSFESFESVLYNYRANFGVENCAFSSNSRTFYIYSGVGEIRLSSFDNNSKCVIENMQGDVAFWQDTFTNNKLIFSHSRQAITKVRDCTIGAGNTTEANIAYNTLTPNGIIFK